jgi:hypothetical protein
MTTTMLGDSFSSFIFGIILPRVGIRDVMRW